MRTCAVTQTLLPTVTGHIGKHLTCTLSLLLCLTSQACIISRHPKHRSPNSINEVTQWTQCGSQGLGHACGVKQKLFVADQKDQFLTQKKCHQMQHVIIKRLQNVIFSVFRTSIQQSGNVSGHMVWY